MSFISEKIIAVYVRTFLRILLFSVPIRIKRKDKKSSLTVYLSQDSTTETRPNIANHFIQLQDKISLDPKAPVAFKWFTEKH